MSWVTSKEIDEGLKTCPYFKAVAARRTADAITGFRLAARGRQGSGCQPFWMRVCVTVEWVKDADVRRF
jgi:hypothetical protein